MFVCCCGFFVFVFVCFLCCFGVFCFVLSFCFFLLLFNKLKQGILNKGPTIANLGYYEGLPIVCNVILIISTTVMIWVHNSGPKFEP